jgi:hypothetical protein
VIIRAVDTVGKVKLSLCLTKHHAMNKYWVSGGISPLIQKLKSRFKNCGMSLLRFCASHSPCTAGKDLVR